jgi:hypothetical protein
MGFANRMKFFQRVWDKCRGKDVIPQNPVATHYGDKFVYAGAEAEAILARSLERKHSLLVARFGRTELKIVDWFMRHMSLHQIDYPARRIRQFVNNAGFFGADPRLLTRFSCEFLAIAGGIDILGVWFVINERQICDDCLGSGAQLVALDSLTPGPVFVSPWTRHLAGKKVLVVHPFVDSIRRQYEKREALFANPDVLPEFALITLKAYQSLVNHNPENHATWFDALDDMKRKIDAIDFDVALIGAGAYGMFLAHRVPQQAA